jgi:hypothetical protein
MTGLKRLAVTVAMYNAVRTTARPPKMLRCPRPWPESRLKGQTPTSALIWRRSRRAQFRQGGQQRRCGDRADTRYAAQQVVSFAPDRAGPQPLLEIAIMSS